MFSFVNSLTLTTTHVDSFGLGNFSKESASPWSINFPGQAYDMFPFTEVKSTQRCSSWLTWCYMYSSLSVLYVRKQSLLSGPITSNKVVTSLNKTWNVQDSQVECMGRSDSMGNPFLSYPLDPDSSWPEHSAIKITLIHQVHCTLEAVGGIAAKVCCFWESTEPLLLVVEGRIPAKAVNKEWPFFSYHVTLYNLPLEDQASWQTSLGHAVWETFVRLG